MAALQKQGEAAPDETCAASDQHFHLSDEVVEELMG
jgi:hypothetical protein